MVRKNKAKTPVDIDEVKPRVVSRLRRILVRHEAHVASPHILRLRVVEKPAPEPQSNPAALAIPQVPKWWLEVSALAVLASVGWVAYAIARYVFRLPFSEMQPTPIKKVAPAKIVKKTTKKVVVMRSWNLKLPKLVIPQIPSLRWHLNLNQLVPRLVAVVVVSSLLLSPIWAVNAYSGTRETQALVMASATAALQSFTSGAELSTNRQFGEAEDAFARAVIDFEKARQQLDAVPSSIRFLANITPERTKIKSAEELLVAGAALGRVGRLTAKTLALAETQSSELPSAAFWDQLTETARTVQPDLLVARQALEKVTLNDLPDQYRDKVLALQAALPALEAATERLAISSTIAQDFLGYEAPKRYLIMFQNNHELRASGGFLGSFAVVTLADGKVHIENVPTGGTYDLRGGLRVAVQSPQPLQLIRPQWEFQDANWWVDWPTTSRKLIWFYSQATVDEAPIDGVIALDVTFMENLLNITGPIAMPDYNLTITADNFADETQREVELRYGERGSRPKQFIADLMPTMVARLGQLAADKPIPLVASLLEGLSEKHFLLYRSNDVAEQRLMDLGWSGEVGTLPPFTDGLLLVHTNIAGGKSDAVVHDEVTHVVQLSADGSLVDTVTLKRVHKGQKGEVFTGLQNVDYLRAYVPQGSELLYATGFTAPDPALFKTPAAELAEDVDLATTAARERTDELSGTKIYDEFERTVFANWVMVKPGETTTVRLTYRLPWRANALKTFNWGGWMAGDSHLLSDRYQFIWQKQPGVDSTTFTQRLQSENPLTLIESSAPAASDAHGFSWSDANLKTDRSFVAHFSVTQSP